MSSPRGKRPLPSKIVQMRGTERAHRINELEPKPKSDALIPPKDLTPEALVYWDDFVKQLTDCGIMTNIDCTALGMLCSTCARWKEANEKIRTGTMVYRSSNGDPRLNPYLSIANKEFVKMHKMLTEFGMTPSSRTRVERSDKSAASEYDPWTDM